MIVLLIDAPALEALMVRVDEDLRLQLMVGWGHPWGRSQRACPAGTREGCFADGSRAGLFEHPTVVTSTA